ncbi:EAL domain-containing protein [Oceanobacillus alkalisoli]|uniref:EAL domain-containing protein n=1 Tax=Oceanobacillus TaxID=182709 RepID=UPI0034D97388
MKRINFNICWIIVCTIIFQLITDIHDSKILGYEGLLRSSCTKNPESLFNTAINLKKIFELDLYSINTAIQTFNDYVDKTTSDTHLFLNIHPTTLVSPNFKNILCDRIENSKITTNCLVLETQFSQLKLGRYTLI